MREINLRKIDYTTHSELVIYCYAAMQCGFIHLIKCVWKQGNSINGQDMQLCVVWPRKLDTPNNSMLFTQTVKLLY